MRWQDIEGTWWTIPADVAKNGRSHRVPLNPQAVTILDRLQADAKGVWVFPSPTTDRAIENPQKTIGRVRERSKVPGLRLHDLRRTAASLMTGMGISRLTVKKILNHAERDVTAVYDRHSYDPEKRAALEAWGRRLDAIITDTASESRTVPLASVGGSRRGLGLNRGAER
jgi:integrase